MQNAMQKMCLHTYRIFQVIHCVNDLVMGLAQTQHDA